MAEVEDASPFSPYRSDGKLVRSLYLHAYENLLIHLQYGFICVVTGATQPIGQAIVHELASIFCHPRQNTLTDTVFTAHGAACIYGTKVLPSLCTPAFNLRPACTRTSNEELPPPLSALSTSRPNTKIIPYPLSFSDEQATLTLIDDVLNAWGRLDVWVTSSGLLGPPSIDATTPADLQKCFEANSLAPFFALKYAPPAMGKLTPKGHYPNAAPKDEKYGSIVVVSSVASTYGGM